MFLSDKDPTVKEKFMGYEEKQLKQFQSEKSSSQTIAYFSSGSGKVCLLKNIYSLSVKKQIKSYLLER